MSQRIGNEVERQSKANVSSFPWKNSRSFPLVSSIIIWVVEHCYCYCTVSVFWFLQLCVYMCLLHVYTVADDLWWRRRRRRRRGWWYGWGGRSPTPVWNGIASLQTEGLSGERGKDQVSKIFLFFTYLLFSSLSSLLTFFFSLSYLNV